MQAPRFARRLGAKLLFAILLASCSGGDTTSQPPRPAERARTPVTQDPVRAEALIGRPDFDGDGQADLVSVVGAVMVDPASRRADAFRYGALERISDAKCLQLRLTGAPVWPASAPAAVALCGQSPIMALQPEVADSDRPKYVQAHRRGAKGGALAGITLSEAPAADVILLDTQAGSMAVYWTGSRFRWEEMPGGE